ncbi:MAG TPA: mechanosensitive ion channel family protein [Candidatus Limnocylindrales bacterium]|nr:mechanosensitive ion channel family protein [Candidatus Limnocylindrales bacterium]
MNSDLLLRAALAFALGLVVGLMARALRRFGPVGRLRFSAVLATWTGCAYALLAGSGIVEQPLPLQILLALAVLFAADTVLQLIDLLLWTFLLDRRRGVFVPRLLVDVFDLLALLAVGLLLLKFVFGVSLTGLLVTSTVVSAIIGLALQDILGNLIAGLALQVERPFTVGDWVMVGGREGYVTQLNWRTLSIRTRDSDDIIIPNAIVAKSEISNFTRPTPLQRLHVTVGVGYEHPPGTVKEALTRAAAAATGVVPEPPIEALVLSFGDFAVQYDVRFWIMDFARVNQITDDVLSRIWYELRRCQIHIPVPLRQITMRTLAPDDDAERARRHQREIFEVLRPLDLFSPLDDAQIQELVHGATLHRYGPGEVLVKQGDLGNSLFVLRSGRARVEVIADAPADAAARSGTGLSPTVLDVLDAGAFFGEMSLLTGAPRSASVIAETDIEVVIVDKEALAPILSADIGILEGLSEVVERHARNTAERLTTSDLGTVGQKTASTHAAILRSIRRFFGMSEE